MKRNASSLTAFVFINSDRWTGNVFYFFEGLKEPQPATSRQHLDRLAYGNGRVYHSTRDLRFKRDGYSIARDVQQIRDTFTQEVVAERIEGNILDMVFAEGQLYDIGHYGLFRTFDHTKIADSRGGTPISLAYGNGRLYHSIMNPNGKYGGIALDSFDNRVVFEKEGHIKHLAFGNGRLFGAGEFRIPGGILDHEFRVYDLFSGELVAKRKYAIKSLAFCDGRLFDSSYSGCVFDTFSGKTVAQRKPVTREKVNGKKMVEDDSVLIVDHHDQSGQIYQTILKTDGKTLYDLTTSGDIVGESYNNPIGVIYDTLKNRPICSTFNWWPPSLAEMEVLGSSNPERVRQYYQNQEWLKEYEGWIEDFIFVPVSIIKNLLKYLKR